MLLNTAEKGLVRKHNYVLNKKTNKKYYTKQELIASQEKYKYEDLIYILNDNFWTTTSWTEPNISFSKLLTERCIQLRDKYDYLVLYYSGGSDSETVLKSFIRSKVHLDEVVLNIFKVTSAHPLHDLELAAAKLQHYQRYLPKTKITINELDRDFFLKFNSDQTWIDSSFNGTIGNFRRLLINTLAELGQPVDVPKSTNVAYMLAEMKPVIIKKDDGYYARWSLRLGSERPGAVWFFTTPDLPQLHVKQCYLIKNYFIEFFPDVTDIREQVPEIRDYLVRSCRYTYDARFQPPKMTGMLKDIGNNIISEDSIVVRHLKQYDKESYDAYIYGTIKPMVKSIPHILLNKDSGDLRELISQEFYLGN